MMPESPCRDDTGDDVLSAFPAAQRSQWRPVRWSRLDHAWAVGEMANEHGQRREYIAHLSVPRFVARVVALDFDGRPEPHEEPVRSASGTYRIDEQNQLCEVEWIDPVRGAATRALLRSAAGLLEQHYGVIAATPEMTALQRAKLSA
jgi:hypothetical protein